jgi:AcrR family transcriptional regulator
MARRRYTEDQILDVAARFFLDRGELASIDLIAWGSGAPVGSIYYRFPSRDELYARLWLRAAEGLQAVAVDAADDHDGARAGVAVAVAVYAFCEARRADARLLIAFPDRPPVHGSLPWNVRDRLRELDASHERAQRDLAWRVYGSRGRTARDRVARAALDLPFGVARRHVIANSRFPARARDDLRRAVQAILGAPLT